MAKITANFSNGHSDPYCGTRPVKAAWAIVRKSDNTTLASGHSLDRSKAQTTASSNLRYVLTAALGRRPEGISDRPDRSAGRHVYFNGLAKKQGYKNWKEAYAAYQSDVALAQQLVIIEVIDL